jgi:hypothetical protein
MKLQRLAWIFVFALNAAAQTDQPVRTDAKNPDAIAVLIGISDYQSIDIPDVEFAVNDVEGVRGMVTSTLGYSPSRVLVRTNSEASLAQLRPLFRQELPATVTAGKTDVFVFYSGHGAPSADNRQAYLIPWDYNPRYAPSTDSAYPLRDFYQDLQNLKARRIILVLDACFSGQSDSGSVVKDASPILINVENPAGSLPNGIVVTATGPQEIATWYRERRHGLLTHFFLQAFRGEGANADGRLSAATLAKYLSEQVPVVARQIKGRVQNPQVVSLNPDEVLAQLPVSAVRSGAAQLVETFGSLRISVDLGGDLYIDNILQVTIPPGRAFLQQRIAAGPHLIEIRKNGYAPISEEVIVPSDGAADRSYSMRNLSAVTPRVEPPVQPAVVQPAPQPVTVAPAPPPRSAPAPAPAAAAAPAPAPVDKSIPADKLADPTIWFMGQWPGLTIGFNPSVYIDEKAVGKLGDNRFFGVVLAPGRHYLSLRDNRPKPDDDGWVDLKPGDQIFIKGDRSILLGGFSLDRVEDTEARRIMSGLKPIDSKNALDPRVILTPPSGKD